MNEQPNVPMIPTAREPIYQNWVRALTRPSEQTFAAIAASPNAKASTGYLWYFVGSLVQTLITTAIPNQALQNLITQYTGLPTSGVSIPGILCGAPIGALISTFFFMISTAVVQWIAGLFKGRGNNDRMAFTLSTILTPFLMISGVLTLLSAIPNVGWLFTGLTFVVGLYVLALEVMAVKGVNGFGWGAALASLLLPLLVIAFTCACLAAGMIALLGPSISEYYQQLQQSIPQQ